MIARQIRQHLSAERGLQILDAGCGKGFLTDSLRSFGHEAVGFDSSPVAIDYATEKYGEHFSVSQLHQYAPTSSFDVVVCMDVLFHVLKDDLWEASLRALARCASTESLLIITDVFGDASFPLGDYIVHRSRIQYEEVLVDYGFTLVELEPYDFGANPNSLGVFRRAA